jgi:hypothetical protein
MFKRTILALTVATVTVAGVAAQENATLWLRSGERVTGQLVDMGGSGFAVRVNGQDRNIATNDVAVIDFTGGNMSDADWNRIGSNQGVMLRNGDVVQGQLYDIGGTSPLRITLKTASGDREFSSGEIGRIVLARPTGNAAATGTTGAAVPEGDGIAVAGNVAWTPTGITVRRGETLTFNTTGEVQLSTDPADVAGSAGAKSQRYAQGAALPQHFAGALIARVGNGQPFPIGNQTTVTVPAAGQLFLGVNDDNHADNTGGFRVKITRGGRR